MSFALFSLSGQQYLTNIKFYNDENGLAGLYVNCTFEDSRGLVWVGTQFGLHRFDGEEFLIFNEDTGLPFSQIMEIHEDDEGWLWLFRNCKKKKSCTRNLTFMHSITYEIQTFEERFGNSLDFDAEELVSIASSKDGEIFFTNDKAIFCWAEKKVRQVAEFPASSELLCLLPIKSPDKFTGFLKIKDAGVMCVTMNMDGDIIMQQNVPSLSHNSSPNSFRLLGIDPEGRQIIKLNDTSIDTGTIVILQENGNLTLDSTFHNAINTKKPAPSTSVSTMVSKEDYLFLRAYHSLGIREDDFGTLFPELDRTGSNRQTRFDKNNVAWIAGRYGLWRIKFEATPFRQVLHSVTTGIEPTLKYICHGINYLDNTQFLLSTERGVYLQDSLLERKPELLTDVNKEKPIIFSETLDKQLWGIKNNFIHGLKVQGNKAIVDYITPISTAFTLDNVFTQQFREGKLWLGTEKGLFIFDYKEQNLTPYDQYNGYEELRNSLVHQIYPIDTNQWWLCASSGLYLFSPIEGVLKRFWSGGEGESYLPILSIYQIQAFNNNSWWLGAVEGLIYWQPEKKEINHYTTKNGLPSNEILAIHEDDYGFLWLATNQGLVQWHIEEELLKIYTKENGICTNDFEPYSYFAQPDGRVWLGSTDGYTVFHPKDFKDVDLNEKPNVKLNILHFEQFSAETEQLENRTAQLLQNQEITLLPGEQFFNLRVALADYVNSSEVTYAYRIEGYQDFWQEGNENRIRISGLPYGDYVLKIRGQLTSGQYSVSEIHLPIKVLRPFYRTRWFLFTSIISLFGLVVAFFKLRTQQLRTRQAELEQAVKTRTKTVIKQADELAQLDRLKNRFFANVSHELRTPLTLLLGPLASALKSNNFNSKTAFLLNLAQKNGQKLLQLVNEILDLTKLESGKLALEEETINVFPFIQRLVSHFESHAEHQNIRLSLDYQASPDLQVFFDTKKFETVLNNLLSNALKFTPNNGYVKVVFQDAGEKLQLQVIDSGPGIHPNDLPHLFDRFYQSKQAGATLQGGTGIGLALCREYADLFSGKITVESELGKGAAFSFVFPKKETQYVLESSTQKSSFQNSNPGTSKISDTYTPTDTSTSKILIVEDNQNLQEYIKIILANQYQVITADNGKAALDILETTNQIEGKKDTFTNSPSLIISDLIMPVMDGFQFVEKMKNDDRFRHIPTIMLTARAEMQNKLQALRIGVDDYMTKPFEEEELIARIKNLLKNATERRKWLEEAEPELEIETTSNDSHSLYTEETEWLKTLEQIVALQLTKFEFNTQMLADEMTLSRSQLFRRLKKNTGLTPSQYIKEARLNKARLLLETRAENSVKAVAYTVGLRHLGHFAIDFKARFGKSPSTYF